jgi:hypothetical protein
MKCWLKLICAFLGGALLCAAAGGCWLYRTYHDMEWYLQEKAEARLAVAVDWIAQTNPVHVANVRALSPYLDADAIKNQFRVYYSTNRCIFTLRPLAAIDEAPYVFLSEIGNTNFAWASGSSLRGSREDTLLTLVQWHAKYETTVETNRIDLGDEVIPYLYSPDGEGGSVMSAIAPMTDKQMLIGVLGFKYTDVDLLRDEEDIVTKILRHRITQQPAAQVQSEGAPSD